MSRIFDPKIFDPKVFGGFAGITTSRRTATVAGLLPAQVTETAKRTAALAGGVTLVDSTLAVVATQTLSPGLLPSSLTFPPFVLSYTVTLAPGLLPSTTSVFPPAVSGLAQLLPGLLESTNAFPVVTITAGSTLAPGLLPSENQFYEPLVQALGASQLVVPELLPSGNQFFPLVVSRPGAAQVLAPELLVSQSTFFAPEVGAAPPEIIEPPAHWGGIGGPGGLFPVSREALARGGRFRLKLVLEPGTASGVVAVALSVPAAPPARHAHVQVSVADVPAGARVLGDGFELRLTLDQGTAFGEKNWTRTNEELLLLVA